MKTLDYIPTSKIERATKLVQTGAKWAWIILDTIVEK
jgi:hypothetical protein